MALAAGGGGANREKEGRTQALTGPEHLRLRDRIPFILLETRQGLLFVALVPTTKDRRVACP